jgi:hypothetical protein
MLFTGVEWKVRFRKSVYRFLHKRVARSFGWSGFAL